MSFKFKLSLFLGMLCLIVLVVARGIISPLWLKASLALLGLLLFVAGVLLTIKGDWDADS